MGKVRGKYAVWLGAAAALAVGLPLVLWGFANPPQPTLTWFVPVCDAVAFVCMIVVALLGALDAELRENRRSLPVVLIASATAVMWAGHFAMFPGDFQALQQDSFNQATSTLFLTINLLTPLLLCGALLQRGGPLPQPRPQIAAALAAGGAVGVIAIAFAIATVPFVRTVSSTGDFFAADKLVGVAGLVPAVIGLIAFMAGRHGDERIAGGVLAALTFTALNSITLVFLHARYTASWYADHTLALLVFVALLGGQLWLYTGSVVAERMAARQLGAAAERRRVGLDVAKAMATETDLLPVVDRLLTGVIDAVAADRATMLRLLPDGFMVERGVDRGGVPARVGTALAMDAVVTGSRNVVREAVESKRPVVVERYRVVGLDPPDDPTHVGIEHAVVMPFVRAGAVDGVLIVGRRADRPFAQRDVDQLEELSAIAALLIRNARLLAESESTSRAKSNFINLAAHELGTPISVIRGYIDMLADETLGPVSEEQKGPMQSVRTMANDLAVRVDQLLTASRLEAGTPPRLPAMAHAVDLTVAVHEALSRARDRARLIGATLAAEMPSGPVEVAADPRDLAIICDNLVNNAMTYSRPPAEVRVEVVADGEAALLRVTDRGIGIPEHARERIFDQFYRVDDAEFGYPAGTGLGLYISRRLAERHGGALYVERSTPGEGTTFALRLPWAD